ncbi:Vik1p KNAG_0D00670 [Huiozyma naganishii CBS 8797]|uniref:Spindle pole body-associated protein Vik1/Cik1 microtubule binding domain-containing protein n=1 Tax=Huiozyma naganishii (strain ATCC MYA-139 / BCRC 22969 / CBS 8797 / KCTC 17520 / NBRC 10181 / NCYC 3082 / Yp74L-3) TaxID=1071383 RepID=J7S5F4_HUIN7|nr:hypothetical protein KNAG_0D00670 [Kazachstania naganishii CBS 8797]CCK69819.1 hypothetical protein KNAG_0D00670 [Kazachstania naganishii CBS 8797]
MELEYQLNRRVAMCRKVTVQCERFEDGMNHCSEQLTSIEEEFKSTEEKLKVDFANDKSLLEEKFAESINEMSSNYNHELMELEKITAKDELEVEMNRLRKDLIDLLEDCDTLKLSNEKAVAQKGKTLAEEFEQHKLEKNSSLELLITNYKQSMDEKISLLNDTAQLRQQNSEMEKRLNDLEKEIAQITSEIDKAVSEKEAIENEKLNIEKNIEEETDKMNKLILFTKENEGKYNDWYNTVEYELSKRKKLENSIDELKGKVRCFGYISGEVQDKLSIDYIEGTIVHNTTPEENRSFHFTRILPSNALPLPQLLFREYKPFHDLCLSEAQDFNLFTVSNGPWSELQFHFMEFLKHEYCDNFEITVQNVFLSDEKISKDLLIPRDSSSKSCITVQIESNLLILNTRELSLKDYLSFMNSEKNKTPYNVKNGINLYKLKFQSREDPSAKTVNFHLVQFEDLTLLSVLQEHLISPRFVSKTSHIGLLITKLLHHLKSCFFFNLDDCMDDGHLLPTLNFASDIGKIPNPKKPEPTSKTSSMR